MAEGSSACEGFFIEVWNRVARVADSIVTFVACSGCFNGQSDALFANVINWSNPPGTLAGNPKIIGLNSHVQAVAADSGMAKGLRERTIAAAHGRPSPACRMICATCRSSPHAKAVIPAWPGGCSMKPFAPAVCSRGFEINKLARMTQRLRSLGANTTYPGDDEFRRLGIMPTMFAWYQVFAVAPNSPNLLIAPDVINQKMMRSDTGGEIWQEIPG